MAAYTKATDDKGTTRYKDGNKFVKGDDVPTNIKEELEKHPDGTIVDELGAVVDPNTEDDESEDEQAPGADDPNNGDDDDEDIDHPANLDPNRPPESEEGMGFTLVKGFTPDIFDRKTPHTHIKYVNGVMVPLTEENYYNKSDQEITKQMDVLRKKKLTTL